MVVFECKLKVYRFRIVLYFEYACPRIREDYEIFRQKKPVYFMEVDQEKRRRLEDIMENQIKVVDKVDFNKSFVGDHGIDSVLNEIAQLAIDDYVGSWYPLVSGNQEFTSKLYNYFNLVGTAFSNR